MSFLALVVLVMMGFACFMLWRIAGSLMVIAACVGFDEVKKAGIIDEMVASTRQQLAEAARIRT